MREIHLKVLNACVKAWMKKKKVGNHAKCVKLDRSGHTTPIKKHLYIRLKQCPENNTFAVTAKLNCNVKCPYMLCVTCHFKA